jgi:Na+/proline symporter
MDTFSGAKPVESELDAGRGSFVPAGLVGAGITLIVVVGLIHLIDAPEDLEEGSYLGFLFLANFLGALVASVGIYRGNRWGWVLGLLVAGGAFVGYVISRTAGLPGLGVEEEWLEPLGVLSLIVEALFVGVFLAILVRPESRVMVVETSSSSPDVHKGGSS